VDRLKSDCFVEEHDREHMFQANVGNVAIADGVCFIGGDADDHFLNVIGP